MKIHSTSNDSLLATLHYRNNYTTSDMSDVEYEYEYEYDEDEDEDDCLRNNGHRVEDFEDIKDYERGIMIAERKVDDHVARLGCTVFQGKGYDSRTKSASWTVCILLKEEENNNEATDKENNNDAIASNKESLDTSICQGLRLLTTAISCKSLNVT